MLKLKWIQEEVEFVTTNPAVVLLAQEGMKFGVSNILSSAFQSLKNSFEKDNWESYWISDDIQKKEFTTIAFNVAGLDLWKIILNSGCTHLMWLVDSCFYQNFSVIDEYIKYPGFHVLIVSKADIEPLNYFYPEFKNYHYMAHTVDSNYWKYENQEKDLDIVYFASVQDPELMMKAIKEKLPANLFDDFMDMYNYLETNPYKNIWQLYKEVFSVGNDTVDKQSHLFLFHYFFKEITYLLSYTKRIELVKSMEDVGVNIWGPPVWQKYVSGKNKYMGSSNFEDSIKILPRSKISLNLQPLQIIDGLHERILNSALCESAVLCDPAPEIKKVFGDSLSYYDVTNFTNIKQKALTLLSNKEMREHKVQKAKEIVLRDHTWDSRIKTIQSIILNNKVAK